jgi:hypothetical protein
MKTVLGMAGKTALVMLPFALAIPALLLLPSQAVPSAALSGLTLAPVTEAEYRSHVEFQSGFSQRPLGNQANRNYPAYELAPDGLVRPAEDPPEGSAPLEFPAFPLQALMDFLGTP